jgi:DNA (cytosine-5)-methyltransferase 1
LAVSTVFPDSRVVGYVERDAYAASVLLARMEDASLEPAPVWCGNLEDLDPAPFFGVDLVTAGFPCQPWSAAGKRRGTDDERWIWPAIASLLRGVRPRLVFLENVRALISRGGLGLVLADLADLGFDAEWAVLSAGEVGASQQRERVFILADARSSRRSEVARGALGDEGPHEGRSADGADIPNGGGEDVAERDGSGLPSERGYLRADGLASRGRDADGRGGATVADGDFAGRQGPGCPRSDRGHVASRVPTFPPGPDERDWWNAILECEPGLEPSLCRVADGAADWLGTSYASRDDQLRLLGNGVVPQQAETALRILWGRLR